MLDMNWSFVEDARRLAGERIISTPAPINSADSDGGLSRGLAILGKIIKNN